MRGTFHSSDCGVQADGDTSSSASSPHSNNEEEIIEVGNLSFMPKPIYNFSIPDVIKHEPRQESHLQRKRGFSSRGVRISTPVTDEREKSSRKRRKRANENHRDVLERQVIDLTEVDSHDEGTMQSDSEVNLTPNPHFYTSPGRSRNNEPENSFISVLSGLEQFRHCLEQSRERMHIMRPNVWERLRRRRSTRGIVTDGPLFTDDMLASTPEVHNVRTPENADDSVVFVEERGGANDQDIALRMANDPNFSPPYHTTPTNTVHHPRHTRNSADYQQLYCRERIAHACRINLQARERLERIHESINNLRHSTLNEPRPVRGNTQQQRGQQALDNNSPGDVEFVREMLPRTFDSYQPFFDEPITFNRSLFSRHNIFMNSLLRPMPPPRLHHIQTEDFEALWDLTERIGPAKPRGLSKTELDGIPSFRYSSGTAKETNSKCVVCMSEYVNREKLRRLQCSHDFHAKCIDKWLRSNRTCPVCRDDVKTTNETD